MHTSRYRKAWERALVTRPVLPLDPNSKVAIKRDVRSFDIDCAPLRLVRAFAETMADSDRRFGLVRVLRSAQSVGKPFRIGERFQGRFSVPQGLLQQLSGQGELGQRFAFACSRAGRRWAGSWLEETVRRLEDQFASDYGEITELETDTLPARVQYVYLKGSYIAGSSTFIVEGVQGGRCRLTQIWLYQEIHARYVKWIGTEVLRMHLAVVHSQVEQACERVGARILRSDIPEAYLSSAETSADVARGSSLPVLA